MITITQGLKDHKVQIVLDGVLLYEYTNSEVELDGCYLKVKSQGNTLVTLFSSECKLFMMTETP